MRNTRHILKQSILLTILSTAVAQSASADVSISGVDNINIDAWAGVTGSLQGTDDYCVTSFTQTCTGPWWNRTCTDRPRDYDVAAYTNNPTPSGNFILTHDTSSSVTLPVIFEWEQPSTNNRYEMTDYTTTGFTAPPSNPFAEGAVNCSEANALNRIIITVDQGALASAIAGTYSETFYIDMCRIQGGFECVTPVNFSVTLPELIQITQLQDLSFGTWVGIGNAQAVDDFCVFRNGEGGFSLTASGNNDAGSTFQVASGADNIPYTIEFGDGVSWFSSTPGVQLSSTVTGFVGDSTRDCAGGTTHSMRVTIQEADLSSVRAGDYNDTVTIFVEPQ